MNLDLEVTTEIHWQDLTPEFLTPEFFQGDRIAGVGRLKWLEPTQMLLCCIGVTTGEIAKSQIEFIGKT